MVSFPPLSSSSLFMSIGTKSKQQSDDVSELAPGTFESKSARGRKKKNQKSQETIMRERAVAGTRPLAL